MSLLLGLVGNPTVGKSKVANLLVKEHGFYLLDTKDLLREITSTITSIPISQLNIPGVKSQTFEGKEVRLLMGEIGLVLEKLYGEDFLLRFVIKNAPKDRDIIVDSLRQNQAKFFKGKIIEVTSKDCPKPSYRFDEYSKILVDYNLTNPGDIHGLADNVQEMLGKLRDE